MDNRIRLARSASVIALATAVAAAPVWAQDAAGDEETVETITVTAQKREQSLQDVPISISVITGDEIQERAFRRMEDLSESVVNFQLDEQIGQPAIEIRGIGTTGLNFGFEQSVASFTDDVYYGRSRVQNLTFLDLQQIEVLRGPQPTFFGQNATAGALNTRTRNPSLDVWEVNASAEYGQDGEYNLEGGVGGPIAPGLGLRLAASYNNTDGWLERPVYNADGSFAGTEDTPQLESFAVRGTVHWEPTDNFTANLKLSYGENQQAGFTNQIVECPSDPVAFTDPFSGQDFNAYSPCAAAVTFLGVNYALDDLINENTGGPAFPATDVDGVSPFVLLNALGWPVLVNDITEYGQFDRNDRDVEATAVRLKLDYELGDHTLTSITAYTDYAADSGFQLDLTPYFQFGAAGDQEETDFSQEVRLSSPTGQFFEYLVGGYYRTSEFETQNPGIYANAPGSGTCNALGPFTFGAELCQFLFTGADQNTLQEDNTWWSLYGSGTFNISDRLAIDFGVRHEDVKKEGLFFVSFPDNSQLAFTSGFGIPYQVTLTPGTPVGPFVRPEPCSFADEQAGLCGGANFAEETFEDQSTDFSVGGRFNVNDNMMVYAKWAQGFKSGGFNFPLGAVSLDPSGFVFDSEEVEGFELGTKVSALDGAFTANVAWFHSEFSELQVSAFDNDTGEVLTDNAAVATTQGVEIDGFLTLNDYLRVNYAFGYQDAKYDEYSAASCSEQLAPAALQYEVVPGTVVCDFSGLELVGVPNWSINLSPTLNFPVMNGGYSIRLAPQLILSDGYVNNDDYSEIRPQYDQDNFEIINVTASFAPANGPWEIGIYGRNVTDTRELNIWGDSFGNVGAFAVDRGRGSRWGGRVSVNF